MELFEEVQKLKEKISILEEEIMSDKTLTVIKIKDTGIIPSYAHEGDSGLDLYTAEDCVLKPGETKIIPTGLAFIIPKTNYRTFDITVKGRSGNDSKGVKVVTTKMVYDEENGDTIREDTIREDMRIKTGTVDNIYTGEVGIITKNNGYGTIIIPAKTKLAQAIVREVILVNVIEGKLEDIPTTERNDDGYGSTDK